MYCMLLLVIHSSIHSFICSFIYSFIHSFITQLAHAHQGLSDRAGFTIIICLYINMVCFNSKELIQLKLIQSSVLLSKSSTVKGDNYGGDSL